MAVTTGTDPKFSIKTFNSQVPEGKSVSIAGLKDQLKEKTNSYGICCFSKTWDNILMWSHYADKHSGICVGYDDSNDDGDLAEVQYSSHYPDLHLAETVTPDGLDSFLQKYLITKSAEWLYENEYRLISLQKCNQSDSSPFPISSITFGLSTDPILKKTIIDQSKGSTTFYNAIHEPNGKYRLFREPYFSDKK